MKQVVGLYLYSSEIAWDTVNAALEQAINQHDASIFHKEIDRLVAQPQVNVGALNGINCLDYRVEGDMATWAAQSEELERIAPRFASIAEAGDLICQSWGHSGTQPPKALHAKGSAPILVIGTTGDPATPYEWSEALAEQLDSGQLLTWEGNGHLAYGNAGRGPCVVNAVETYLLTGAMPDKELTCHGSE
jgi:TAP domain protein